MPTMQEVGQSWDKQTIGQIILISPLHYDTYKEVIEEFLEQQPESWAGVCTLEEMLDLIERGFYTPWLYLAKDGYKGMMLTSLQTYTYGSSVRIEFLSCRNFYTMMRMEGALEKKALALGLDFMEAVAHPTMAEYAQRKCGWVTPGVAIRKDLRVERRN